MNQQSHELADNVTHFGGRHGQQQDVGIPNMANPVSIDSLTDKLNITFTIGADDKVEGKITVGEGKCVVIRGEIEGDVVGKGFVILMAGGRIKGNIVASQVWIEGDVGSENAEKPSTIHAGVLHIGVGACVIADCTYSGSISISTPNRGVKGRLDYEESHDQA